MSSQIKIGDHVRIQLDAKFGEQAGWYEGKVIKIDPYSQHRSFYWVELNEEAQSILKIKQISIFNPKNIEKID